MFPVGNPGSLRPLPSTTSQGSMAPLSHQATEVASSTGNRPSAISARPTLLSSFAAAKAHGNFSLAPYSDLTPQQITPSSPGGNNCAAKPMLPFNGMLGQLDELHQLHQQSKFQRHPPSPFQPQSQPHMQLQGHPLARLQPLTQPPLQSQLPQRLSPQLQSHSHGQSPSQSRVQCVPEPQSFSQFPTQSQSQPSLPPQSPQQPQPSLQPQVSVHALRSLQQQSSSQSQEFVESHSQLPLQIGIQPQPFAATEMQSHLQQVLKPQKNEQESQSHNQGSQSRIQSQAVHDPQKRHHEQHHQQQRLQQHVENPQRSQYQQQQSLYPQQQQLQQPALQQHQRIEGVRCNTTSTMIPTITGTPVASASGGPSPNLSRSAWKQGTSGATQAGTKFVTVTTMPQHHLGPRPHGNEFQQLYAGNNNSLSQTNESGIPMSSVPPHSSRNDCNKNYSNDSVSGDFRQYPASLTPAPPLNIASNMPFLQQSSIRPDARFPVGAFGAQQQLNTTHTSNGLNSELSSSSASMDPSRESCVPATPFTHSRHNNSFLTPNIPGNKTFSSIQPFSPASTVNHSSQFSQLDLNSLSTGNNGPLGSQSLNSFHFPGVPQCNGSMLTGDQHEQAMMREAHRRMLSSHHPSPNFLNTPDFVSVATGNMGTGGPTSSFLPGLSQNPALVNSSFLIPSFHPGVPYGTYTTPHSHLSVPCTPQHEIFPELPVLPLRPVQQPRNAAELPQNAPLHPPAGSCAVCWEGSSEGGGQNQGQREQHGGLTDCSGCGLRVHRRCYGLQCYEMPGVDASLTSISAFSLSSKWYCSVCEYWISLGYNLDPRSTSSSGQNIIPSGTGPSGSGSNGGHIGGNRSSSFVHQGISLHTDDDLISSTVQGDGCNTSKENRVPPPIFCSLCLRPGGAMRVGVENIWVHVACVIYCVEGPYFSLASRLQRPILIKRYLALHRQKGFSCTLCRSSHGFTLRCGFPNCTNRVHVPCAFHHNIRPKLELVPSRRVSRDRLIKIVACPSHGSPASRVQISRYQSQMLDYAEMLGTFSGTSKSGRHHRHHQRHSDNTENSFLRDKSIEGIGLGQSSINDTGGFPSDVSRVSPLTYRPPDNWSVPGVRGNSGATPGVRRRWGTPSVPVEPKGLEDDEDDEEIPLSEDRNSAFRSLDRRQQRLMKGKGGVWAPSEAQADASSGRDSLNLNEPSNKREQNQNGQRRLLSPGALGGLALTKKIKNRVIDKIDNRMFLWKGEKKSEESLSTQRSIGKDTSLGVKSPGRSGRKNYDHGKCTNPVDVNDKLVPTSNISTGGGGSLTNTTQQGAKASRWQRRRTRLNDYDDDDEPYHKDDDEEDDDQESFVSSTRRGGNGSHVSVGSGSRQRQRSSRASGRIDELFTTQPGRIRDGRGRPRRTARASTTADTSDAEERLGSAAHVGTGAHIVQRGVRLKWARSDYLFKRTPFLSNVLAQIWNTKRPTTCEVYKEFISTSNHMEPSLHQLALFLLSYDPEVNIDQFNEPLQDEVNNLVTRVIDTQNKYFELHHQSVNLNVPTSMDKSFIHADEQVIQGNVLSALLLFSSLDSRKPSVIPDLNSSTSSSPTSNLPVAKRTLLPLGSNNNSTATPRPEADTDNINHPVVSRISDNTQNTITSNGVAAWSLWIKTLSTDSTTQQGDLSKMITIFKHIRDALIAVWPCIKDMFSSDVILSAFFKMEGVLSLGEDNIWDSSEFVRRWDTILSEYPNISEILAIGRLLCHLKMSHFQDPVLYDFPSDSLSVENKQRREETVDGSIKCSSIYTQINIEPFISIKYEAASTLMSDVPPITGKIGGHLRQKHIDWKDVLKQHGKRDTLSLKEFIEAFHIICRILAHQQYDFVPLTCYQLNLLARQSRQLKLTNESLLPYLQKLSASFTKINSTKTIQWPLLRTIAVPYGEGLMGNCGWNLRPFSCSDNNLVDPTISCLLELDPNSTKNKTVQSGTDPFKKLLFSWNSLIDAQQLFIPSTPSSHSMPSTIIPSGVHGNRVISDNFINLVKQFAFVSSSENDPKNVHIQSSNTEIPMSSSSSTISEMITKTIPPVTIRICADKNRFVSESKRFPLLTTNRNVKTFTSSNVKSNITKTDSNTKLINTPTHSSGKALPSLIIPKILVTHQDPDQLITNPLSMMTSTVHKLKDDETLPMGIGPAKAAAAELIGTIPNYTQSASGNIVEKNRFVLLGQTLWDLDIPLDLCNDKVADSLIKDSQSLLQFKTLSRDSKLVSSSSLNKHSENHFSLSMKTESKRHFVEYQGLYYLSLLSHVTAALNTAKETYVSRILEEEELPPRISEISSALPCVNSVFLMASRWGKVSSHCIWGLSDQPDHDFITTETQTGDSLNNITVGMLDVAIPKSVQPYLAGATHLYYPNLNSQEQPAGGVFGTPIIQLNHILRQFNASDVCHSVLRPFLSASSINEPLPPFAVGCARTKTCSICFGAEWDSGNPVVTCARCFTSVHRACYCIPDTTGDEETETFCCKRCEVEKGKNSTSYNDYFTSGSCRCEFCNTLGGALKRTSDGRWIHLTCAIFFLPETIPGDIKSLDNWDITNVKPWRMRLNCSVCAVSDWRQYPRIEHGKTKASSELFNYSTSFIFGPNGKKDSTHSYHLDCYPLRLSETPPHLPIFQFVTTRRGACVTCSYPGCTRAFHPMCAWMSGMYVEINRNHSDYYNWVSGQDNIYFPQLHIAIFCFDHYPSSPLSSINNVKHISPHFRSSGYQRCLRHRRYINRDLYPHLCGGAARTSRRTSQNVSSVDGLHNTSESTLNNSQPISGNFSLIRGGTPFGFNYTKQSLQNTILESQLSHGVKLQLGCSGRRQRFLGLQQNQSSSQINPPLVSNTSSTFNSFVDSSNDLCLSNITTSIEDPIDNHVTNETVAKKEIVLDKKLQSGPMKQLPQITYFGPDTVDPEDPDSIYLLGQPDNDHHTHPLPSEMSTLLRLTAPDASELTPFPDKYCDRSCAVCYCQSETIEYNTQDKSNVHNDDVHSVSIIDRIKPNWWENPGLPHSLLPLIRCRRCGLAVHKYCYGYNYMNRLDLQSFLCISSEMRHFVINHQTGATTIRAEEEEEEDVEHHCITSAEESDTEEPVIICDDTNLITEPHDIPTNNHFHTFYHNRHPYHNQENHVSQKSQPCLKDNGSALEYELLRVKEMIQKTTISYDLDTNSSVLETDIEKNMYPISYSSQLSEYSDEVFFSCEVCSSCHLVDDLTCLLCSRRGGALKAVRLRLNWTPIMDDDDFESDIFINDSKLHHQHKSDANTEPTAVLYVHITCALLCPGITVGSSDTLQPIKGLERVISSRFYGSYMCSICSSSRGITIPCSEKDCSEMNHPLCMQLDGCILEQRVEKNKIIIVNYCRKHSKQRHIENSIANIFNQLRLLLEKSRFITSEIHSRLLSKMEEVTRLKHVSHIQKPIVSALSARYSCLLKGESLDQEAFIGPFFPLTPGGGDTPATEAQITQYMRSSHLADDQSFNDFNEHYFDSINNNETAGTNLPTSSLSLLDLRRGPIIPIGKLDAKTRLNKDDSRKSQVDWLLNRGLSSTADTENTDLFNEMSVPNAASRTNSPLNWPGSHSGRSGGTDFGSCSHEHGTHTKEGFPILPPLSGLSLDEIMNAGLTRELTVTELVDLSRRLLPEYHRRRRGRPSAKEKLVRLLASGALDWYKTHLLQAEEKTLLNQEIQSETITEMITFPDTSPFWLEAITVAEQYGRTVQSILCGFMPNLGINSLVSSSTNHLFDPTQRCLDETGQLITTSADDWVINSSSCIDENEFIDGSNDSENLIKIDENLHQIHSVTDEKEIILDKIQDNSIIDSSTSLVSTEKNGHQDIQNTSEIPELQLSETFQQPSQYFEHIIVDSTILQVKDSTHSDSAGIDVMNDNEEWYDAEEDIPLPDLSTNRIYNSCSLSCSMSHQQLTVENKTLNASFKTDPDESSVSFCQSPTVSTQLLEEQQEEANTKKTHITKSPVSVHSTLIELNEHQLKHQIENTDSTLVQQPSEEKINKDTESTCNSVKQNDCLSNKLLDSSKINIQTSLNKQPSVGILPRRSHRTRKRKIFGSDLEIEDTSGTPSPTIRMVNQKKQSSLTPITIDTIPSRDIGCLLSGRRKVIRRSTEKPLDSYFPSITDSRHLTQHHNDTLASNSNKCIYNDVCPITDHIGPNILDSSDEVIQSTTEESSIVINCHLNDTPLVEFCHLQSVDNGIQELTIESSEPKQKSLSDHHNLLSTSCPSKSSDPSSKTTELDSLDHLSIEPLSQPPSNNLNSIENFTHIVIKDESSLCTQLDDVNDNHPTHVDHHPIKSNPDTDHSETDKKIQQTHSIHDQSIDETSVATRRPKRKCTTRYLKQTHSSKTTKILPSVTPHPSYTCVNKESIDPIVDSKHINIVSKEKMHSQLLASTIHDPLRRQTRKSLLDANAVNNHLSLMKSSNIAYCGGLATSIPKPSTRKSLQHTTLLITKTLPDDPQVKKKII